MAAVAALAALGQPVAARVRFELDPYFGQLAGEHREGGDRDAEGEVHHDPGLERQEVPWCNCSQPWLRPGPGPQSHAGYVHVKSS